MACRCPRWDCNRLIVSAKIRHWDRDRQTWKDEGSFLVYPHTSNRKPVPPQVPDHIREDYEEACLVLSASTKASAALSRRCLQSLLRAQGYQQHDLSDQIDAVLPTLPKDVADTVDAIRNIGNFAAHTIKSKSTGEILPVEPGEAEWSLEVLEALFEHYYERPTRLAERRKALNEKLSDAGKPPAKGSTP
ncbi:MAG: DUF4145 domain-containing protein [Chloroflexi bacterium]|nr:DUF4145 domain-containing protein [Chloroflexota bacterium]